LARWRHYRRLKENAIFAAVARRERKRDAATSPSRRLLGVSGRQSGGQRGGKSKLNEL